MGPRLPATDASLLPSDSPARALAFSPGGRTLATGGYDRIYLWDAATRKQIGVISNLHAMVNGALVNGATFSPDGTTVAAAVDGEAAAWDVRTHIALR